MSWHVLKAALAAASGKEFAVKNILMVALALFAIGCSDPLVGKWEGKDNNDIDLDIQSGDSADYEGDGHIYVIDGAGATFLCAFDLEATEAGDARFDVEIDFKNECSALGRYDDIECELQNDDEELECDVGGTKIEYEKVGD